MNVKTIVYHSVRHQIRETLRRMGQDRIEAGLSAFEDGSSNWSACFFARAYPELELHTGDAEPKLMKALGFATRVPLKMIWCTFDGAGRVMTKAELRKFIEEVLDESRPKEVLAILRSLDYSNVDSIDIEVACAAH